jgi:hypothetical protein
MIILNYTGYSVQGEGHSTALGSYVRVGTDLCDFADRDAILSGARVRTVLTTKDAFRVAVENLGSAEGS